MIQTPPYITNLIRARAADLGWSIDALARRAGYLPPSIHRALNSRIRSDVADKLIVTMGGLSRQTIQGAVVLVWGDPSARPATRD